MKNIDEDIEIEFVKEKIEECTRIIQSVSNMESKKTYSKERTKFKKVLNLIENKDKELETYKKIAEKLAEQVKRDTVFYDTDGISSCDLSEEKYCKCSKHNNGANCKQCIIDWARKEVEK